MMKVLYFIQYVLFLVIFTPLAALPYGPAVWLGRRLGGLLYYLAPSRRGIAADSIRLSMDKGHVQYPGGAEAMAREVFRNLGQWFVEIIKILFGFGRHIVEGVKVQGLENLERATRGGKGAVLVSAHLGNWELLVLSLTSKIGHTMHGVARQQNNPYINDFMVNAREKFGTKIIYKKGVVRKFISILRKGGVVGMMMDQHVSANMGYMMDFLGSPAWVSCTPATVARKTSSALIPLSMRLTPQGHVIIILPEVDTADMLKATEELNESLQEFIRQSPAQWLWIHRRWKKIPPEALMDNSDETDGLDDEDAGSDD